MKTRDDVERRLKKLRTRYAHRHVQRSQERRPGNCVYNEEHAPRKLEPSVPVEHQMAPRSQVTLVVLNEDRPVRLCMYGAESGKWPGNICDSDGVARSCPMFKPRTSVEEARHGFMEGLADDEHVFNNYRDMATLQWVLGERVHGWPLSWWERLWLFVMGFFARTAKPLPRGPEHTIEGLWDDDPPAAP